MPVLVTSDGRPDGHGCCRWFSMANELTFTYTAVGTIGYPREIRVTIPAGWSEPNSRRLITDEGTYTVALTDEDGRGRANVVEALDRSR